MQSRWPVCSQLGEVVRSECLGVAARAGQNSRSMVVFVGVLIIRQHVASRLDESHEQS